MYHSEYSIASAGVFSSCYKITCLVSVSNTDVFSAAQPFVTETEVDKIAALGDLEESTSVSSIFNALTRSNNISNSRSSMRW